ncbi:MAG: asparagine synthase (glutamine-hydrolyzing) [Candidatus Omnitrophota bacterium]|nr:MAG: asparagine synthase (glutamine-hydrolyzing) [Candidatus Omnitrophota bacterium]
MCGICGMVGFSDEHFLKRMCDKMVHRGPDEEGYFVDEDVGLGVRRLSIIDLQGGHQPIHNEDSTLWVVLNGEIYNYRELRAELEEKGHRFYTKSDTEVLVHLYEDWKEDCVFKLRGMYAFAIWDKRHKELFLARDRTGIKPLYYISQNNKFIFASEIKALLEYPELSKDIDLTSLDYYLTFLYIPAPFTIFKEIRKLLPSSTLTVKDGNIIVKSYWELTPGKEKSYNLTLYKNTIIRTLEDTIKYHLVSDVPIGVFLSGGIDSSTIVAFMRKLGVKDIRTFSIGFGEKYASYNELKFSQLVAKRFNTIHKEFVINPDIVNILPRVIKSLDEPFADSSSLLTYFISEEAAQYVKVALSGIGGDEVFGGYPRYIGAVISSRYARLPLLVRKLFKSISSYIKFSPKGRDYPGRVKRFLKAGLLPSYQRYLSWITYLDREIKEKLYSSNLKEEIGEGDYLHLKYLKEAGNRSYLDSVVYTDINTYLVDDLLVMGDRMSMANSLELRVPFCDYKLMEEAFTIPYHLKLKGLKIKGLFKEILKDILPREVLRKPKQGFMVPLAYWLREDLKDFTLDILSSESIKRRGYFNPSYVKEILSDHFSGRNIFTHQIWALLVLELWFREFIDG